MWHLAATAARARMPDRPVPSRAHPSTIHKPLVKGAYVRIAHNGSGLYRRRCRGLRQPYIGMFRLDQTGGSGTRGRMAAPPAPPHAWPYRRPSCFGPGRPDAKPWGPVHDSPNDAFPLCARPKAGATRRPLAGSSATAPSGGPSGRAAAMLDRLFPASFRPLSLRKTCPPQAPFPASP